MRNKIKDSIKYSILSALGIVGLISQLYYLLFPTQVICLIIGLAILFPLAIYLFLYHFKLLYYIMIFTLPLSIHLEDIGMGIGLSIPGEILLIFVFVGVIWRLIFRFEAYKETLYHPISILIFGHLIWMFASTIMSVLPSVSLKFAALRFIYILVFYIYGVRLFLESGRLKKFILMYTCGFLPVILFSLTRHYVDGNLSIEFANRNCYPFFNDHTIYAACITMILPILYSYAIRKAWDIKAILISILMTIALYFSFSRAAIVSVSTGLLLYLCLQFKLKLQWISLIFVVFISIGGAYIITKKQGFTKNKEENASITEVVNSISDPENHSNNERYNRWMSAYNMFKEKPILGFGPGTFMFVYGRYQEAKTFISVNDASMGGAHSEYLKPLSEEGLLGLLFILGIMFMVLMKGYNLSITLDESNRIVIIACLVGLSTYYIHGIFNFFLDTDKASVLFWGLIAYIVAIDIRTKETIEDK